MWSFTQMFLLSVILLWNTPFLIFIWNTFFLQQKIILRDKMKKSGLLVYLIQSYRCIETILLKSRNLLDVYYIFNVIFIENNFFMEKVKVREERIQSILNWNTSHGVNFELELISFQFFYLENSHKVKFCSKSQWHT